MAERTFRTRVGRPSKARGEQVKGPFVKQIEQTTHDLADAMTTSVKRLREANGPVPAFQHVLSNERLAALHLPEWFVHGNANPDGEVARAYWDDRVGRPDPANPAMAGPRGAHLFAQQMARLWQNPKHRATAFESMPPELRRELLDLVQKGEHPGYAQTLVDGRPTRVEEEGSIDEHLGTGGSDGGR
jgi:hypothetical protein